MILPAPTWRERRRLAALRRADRRADAVLHDPRASRATCPAWGWAMAELAVAAAVAAFLYVPRAAAIAVALCGIASIFTAPDGREARR